MSEEEVQAMESELITNPLRGTVLRQTGGFRKARFAVRGRGKSGGVRVVYYYMTKNKQIILWDIFRKSEQGNVTGIEKAEMREAAILLG